MQSVSYNRIRDYHPSNTDSRLQLRYDGNCVVGQGASLEQTEEHLSI